MSFNIGLSGLYAANKSLDVTGNNIANVATTGFKSSRASLPTSTPSLFAARPVRPTWAVAYRPQRFLSSSLRAT